MLTELPERDATGEIAAIYAEIRRLSAVPYVSSLQRHLATRPGWLEWVWASVRPAFASGQAQVAAWRAVDGLAVPRLAPIAREALRVWGVDGAGEGFVRAACDSFVRVSPVNLVLAGLLRRLLAGERPTGPDAVLAGWTPPAPPGPLPALADVAALTPPERAVLTSLGTTRGQGPFVPGLYRMLAWWPGFLAHVATVLRPQLEEAGTRAACGQLVATIDGQLPSIFAALPAAPATPPMPPAGDFPDVLGALDTYRQTSPEMVVAGLMIRGALPPPGGSEP